MKNPEYVSAQHRCQNQCSRPTHDLNDAYPSLQPKDYSDEIVAGISTALHTSTKEDNSNLGVFDKEFGLEN